MHTSVAHSARRDVSGLLNIAVQIRLKVDTEVFAFDRLSDALECLDKGQIRGGGALQAP